jgi:hypothetical protein
MLLGDTGNREVLILMELIILEMVLTLDHNQPQIVEALV